MTKTKILIKVFFVVQSRKYHNRSSAVPLEGTSFPVGIAVLKSFSRTVGNFVEVERTLERIVDSFLREV